MLQVNQLHWRCVFITWLIDLSVLWILSSTLLWTVHSWTNNAPFPYLPLSGSIGSTFCLQLDCPHHLVWVESHGIFYLCVHFISGPSTLQYISKFCFFLWLNNIQLGRHSIFSLWLFWWWAVGLLPPLSLVIAAVNSDLQWLSVPVFLLLILG